MLHLWYPEKGVSTSDQIEMELETHWKNDFAAMITKTNNPMDSIPYLYIKLKVS